MVEELIRAREAYSRREWLAAYGGLSDAAPDELTPADFARLATAGYLLGRRNDCVQALQRAYQRLRAERTRWRTDDLVLTLPYPALPRGVVIGGVRVAVLSLPLTRSRTRTSASR